MHIIYVLFVLTVSYTCICVVAVCSSTFGSKKVGIFVFKTIVGMQIINKSFKKVGK